MAVAKGVCLATFLGDHLWLRIIPSALLCRSHGGFRGDEEEVGGSAEQCRVQETGFGTGFGICTKQARHAEGPRLLQLGRSKISSANQTSWKSL